MQTLYHFLMAVSLVLVIEGVLPFLSPNKWRNLVRRLLDANDKTLHLMGLISMLIGLAGIFSIHTFLLN